MQEWSKDSLYAKALLFAQRADKEEADSELFPFWSSLALELVCRAALSQIHPTLLADPRDDGGQNLLYACGVNIKGKPRSIPAKTVFLRCKEVIPEFDNKNFDFCILISERRNGELHTGEAAFDGLHTGEWLPEYYATLTKILNFLEKSLEEFLGKSAAKNAQSMLDEEFEKKKGEAIKALKTHQQSYKSLSGDEIKRKIEAAKNLLKEARTPYVCWQKCPACENKGVIIGEIAGYGAPKLGDDGIETETRLRPAKFLCAVCDLKLSGYTSLRAVNLGNIFTITQYEEPHEYFDIDLKQYISRSDIEEMYRDMHYDYGND